MKIYRLFFLIIFFMLPFTTIAESVPEYALKAAFLYNFIDFVNWPTDNNENDTIKKICVFGKNPFDDDLNELANVNAQTNPVVILYTLELSEINSCHILFISRSEQYRLLNILNFLKNKSVLTVSDIHGFAENNGMVELAILSNRVKILLNLEVIKINHIKVNSNLIELATIVKDSETQDPGK